MDPRANTLQRFFAGKGSPLAGYTDAFLSAADRYGLDWRLLPAISGIETSFGKTGVGATGPFGYGSAKSWGSTPNAIDVAAKGLADAGGYYKSARTIDEIGRIWAPVGASNDPNGTNGGWVGAVNSFFRELGGSPGAAVRGGVAGNIPSSASPTGTRPYGGMSAGQTTPQGRAAINAFMRASDAQLAGTGGDLTGQDMLMSKYAKALAAAKAPAPVAGPATGGTPDVGGAPLAPGGGVPLIPGNGSQSRLSKWGGPPDHGSRALGNWQSDSAYDLGGPAGTGVHSPLGGTIIKIGGQPAGPAQFRGYGVTIDHGNGQQAFYKHLGSLGPGIRAGAQITPGMLIGGLADGTGGGPHLHLGATTDSFLNSLIRYYL